MFVSNYKLNEQGLNHFFGPLEARVMEIIWNNPNITIKEVQQKLEADQILNFNTVMTVMNRLVEKGHLHKTTKGRVSLFSPVQTKEDFFHKQTKMMTKELMGEFGDLMLVHMLDELGQLNPQLIEKLEDRLKQLKNESPNHEL